MNNMRKLMETVQQLTEESIEYRDPDGEFQVIYSFPRGYIAIGRNDNKADISGESFDHLEDAIEHAEICLSIRADNDYDENDGQPSDYEEMQDYMGGDDWDQGQYDESTEVVGEESDEGELNDRYDPETLNCKHCGDYFCTSKFGGECPGIQKDMFSDNE